MSDRRPPISHLPARALTQVERDLLAAMLSVDGLPEAADFQRQLSTARAASSCACGCGSIYLITERGTGELTEPSSVIVEGDVLDDNGNLTGGLLLFQHDGWLHDLEVYSFGDAPIQLPTVARAFLRRYGA